MKVENMSTLAMQAIAVLTESAVFVPGVIFEKQLEKRLVWCCGIKMDLYIWREVSCSIGTIRIRAEQCPACVTIFWRWAETVAEF